MLTEEDAFGDLTRTYIGRSAAHVDGTNPSTGTWRFYVHDHLGSTRGVYNSDKTQYAAFEHDPYGEVYASSGSVSDISRRYTGHDWDDAAELYYAPYRYYAAGLARWITRDPLGMVDGPNVYAYVRSSPVRYRDVFGLMRDCEDEQIQCFRRCWRRKPPWPITCKGAGHYAFCQSLCLAEYMECLAENALERTFDALSDALQWLADHPEIVVGTLIVVAGVAMIVTMGPAGGLILVAA